MKTKKISLKEVQGALSRSEMKKIMAGSLRCGMVCGPMLPPCGYDNQPSGDCRICGQIGGLGGTVCRQ